MKTLRAADLFCGAGGASVSFRRALNAMRLDSELLAINHWPTAVATHRKNHPDAVHLCEAVDRVDPKTDEFVDPVTGTTFKPKGRLHLLLAGPECTHHSTARGGRPINDQSRASAWQVLKWLQELYVDNVLIENVPEFREWGPLGANGRPLKSKRGQTYQAFLQALRSLGYTVEDRVLNAADYGDPTTRKRLFIMAKRGNKAIQWPKPTHSKTGEATLFGGSKKWRGAREVIDWSLKGESIFHRKRPLSPKTMARIIAGLERFGGEDLKPFIIVLRRNLRGRSVDEPLPTLTASGTHVALCEPEPFVLQQQSGGVARNVAQPLPTIATGGAIALVEPFVVQPCHGGDDKRRVKSVDEPLGTVPCSNRFAVVEAEVKPACEPFIVPPRGFSQSETRVDSVDAPLRTIVAVSGHQFGVVEPFLVPHYGERPTQAPRTHSVDEPVPTIPATGSGKFDLVEPSFLASYYGTQNISSVDEPVPTVTTKDRFALVMPVVNGRALDIRLRMLKPHELAKAMSFDDAYQFTGNQGEQVKQIGNAWPCRLGQALIQSILADFVQKQKPARLEHIA